MKRVLLSKNKINFVNGEIQKPAKTDALHDAWEQCNVMVISWITHTLNPQITHSTIYIDNVTELWNDLKEKFSKFLTFFKKSIQVSKEKATSLSILPI